MHGCVVVGSWPGQMSLGWPPRLGRGTQLREDGPAKREREKDVQYVDYMGLQWRQTNWEADQSASGKRRKRER